MSSKYHGGKKNPLHPVTFIHRIMPIILWYLGRFRCSEALPLEKWWCFTTNCDEACHVTCMVNSVVKRDTQIPFPMIVNSVNFTGIRKNQNPYFSALPEIARIRVMVSHRDSHSISMAKPPDRETNKCKSVPDNQRSHIELLVGG